MIRMLNWLFRFFSCACNIFTLCSCSSSYPFYMIYFTDFSPLDPTLNFPPTSVLFPHTCLTFLCHALKKNLLTVRSRAIIQLNRHCFQSFFLVKQSILGRLFCSQKSFIFCFYFEGFAHRFIVSTSIRIQSILAEPEVD